VLQEIIQETTNRINRMQKQKSENEVESERGAQLAARAREPAATASYRYSAQVRRVHSMRREARL